MIQINDDDMPIVVAQKIINGTKPYNPPQMVKAIRIAISGNKEDENTQDMFSLEEIKEIADYLMIYYNSHPQGD